LTDSHRSGSPAGTSLHAPEPGVSLGLNIVDFRVQLGVNRWLRTDLRLRDGDLPLIKAYKDRDLLLETGGHLANVGLEVIDGDQNRRHGAKR
jgi:hypothetical protein